MLENGIDLSQPMTVDSIISIVHKQTNTTSNLNILTSHMSEEKYFPAGTDVGVYFHINYLPSFIHKHDYFEIVYVLEGSCINSFSGQSHNLKKGDVLIIFPGSEHSLCVFQDDARVFNIVVRESTFATSFISLLKGHDILSSFFIQALHGVNPSSYVIFSTGADRRISSLILSAYQEFIKNDIYKDRILNATITLFFVELLRRYSKDVIYPTTKNETYTIEAMSILQYVYDNHKNLSLNEVAKHFKYSDRHIARLLKNYTGYSFKILVDNMKLKEATDLLLRKSNQLVP